MSRLLLAICSLVLLCSTNASAVQYRLTRLGNAFGDNFSQAYSINDHGQVVGRTTEFNGSGSAFIWDATRGIRNLGYMPGGGTLEEACGINERGQVAGTGVGLPDDYRDRAFLWDPETGARDLGVWDHYSRGYGLNNLGQVVGTSGYSNIAFLWDPVTRMRGITGNGGGYAVNDAGQVVGGDGSRPFIWSAATGIETLDTSGTSGGAGRAINELGEVAGSDASYGSSQAFFWRRSTGMQKLGFLPGTHDSEAYGINDYGQVVGVSGQTSGGTLIHAFLWTSASGMVDLNTVVDSSGTGWTLQYARDINNHGQIVGNGLNADGMTRAFLLTPVPEPASICALLIGLSSLGWRAGKRRD